MMSVEYSLGDVLSILSKLQNQASDKLEGETLDFKFYKTPEALGQASGPLAEHLCAFANHLGGMIVVGVKDSSDIKAADWSQQLVGLGEVDKDALMNRIKGQISSTIDLRIENVRFEDKNYVAIFVSKNFKTLAVTRSGKSYIREGKQSRPMLSDELEKAIKSLHGYDWSADSLPKLGVEALDETSLAEAKKKFCSLRRLDKIEDKKFLESLGLTVNGILSKGGLLFLGKKNIIGQHLGDFECRFSWREGIDLKFNYIWADNLWQSFSMAQKYFKQCVVEKEINFKGNKHLVPNLDSVAFEEAFVNALVHRDYAADGMVIVEFDGKRLSITSPGGFYGGVTADNIAIHVPRHRNKALATILMTYGFVDRAGVGVTRMGIKSLMYGRRFPRFKEVNNSVQVVMQAEYIRPVIFALTHGRRQLYIHDLVVLNTLYEKAFCDVQECMQLIQKLVAESVWESLQECVQRWKNYIEFCGDKNSIFLKIKDDARELFELDKTHHTPANSEKFVKLFVMLKKHVKATSGEIANLLGYQNSSNANRFLQDIEWIEKNGNDRLTLYRLKDD